MNKYRKIRQFFPQFRPSADTARLQEQFLAAQKSCTNNLHTIYKKYTSKSLLFRRRRSIMISVNKKRKERDTSMTFDKSIACDLDDLIFGSATLVPSER